ncbi:MAG: peptide-methionine (S)-S-oxide reductase MsrA [Candidatus Paceibacterota bacterium]|jgi:peptide-methionine (S)-S-oxide reductase
MTLNEKETIVLGGGCFWCTEVIFASLKGVLSVTSGYAGGTKTNPTYEEVSGHQTGHAEVVKIDYDPQIIALGDILTVFFVSHDPTTLNHQGHDVGTQYRSIILYTTEEQKIVAQEYITKLDAGEEKKIVTQIKPLQTFYPAEAEHQEYYAKNLGSPYCDIIISPKMEKLKARFHAIMKNT